MVGQDNDDGVNGGAGATGLPVAANDTQRDVLAAINAAGGDVQTKDDGTVDLEFYAEKEMIVGGKFVEERAAELEGWDECKEVVMRARAKDNPYGKLATETTALEISKDHPIRFITRDWLDKDLTQAQWNEVHPRIVHMLDECQMQLTWAIGPGNLLTTCAEAIAALDFQIDTTNRDILDMNLPDDEQKHIHALEWAVRILLTQEVLEPRIKKIIGASLTCLIQRQESLAESNETLGIAVIKFSKETANTILTQCMKAYRELDENCLWDINGFEDNDCNLGKMIDGRNLLACCAMIDMQVGPWLEKANRHLKDIGLKNVGLPLGETDLLSRSALLNMDRQEASSDHALVCNYIRAIVRKLPLAVNNEDGDPEDVGFATAGGKTLAKLAPMMFASAQLAKMSGCPWRLIGNEYCLVWLTVGTEVVAPFPVDVGLKLMQVFGDCEDSPLVTKKQKNEMVRYNKKRRLSYYDQEDIPSIDDDEEGVDS